MDVPSECLATEDIKKDGSKVNGEVNPMLCRVAEDRPQAGDSANHGKAHKSSDAKRHEAFSSRSRRRGTSSSDVHLIGPARNLKMSESTYVQAYVTFVWHNAQYDFSGTGSSNGPVEMARTPGRLFSGAKDARCRIIWIRPFNSNSGGSSAPCFCFASRRFSAFPSRI